MVRGRQQRKSRASASMKALKFASLIALDCCTPIIYAGVSIGGEPACFIIEHHLSRFVEGQDPYNVELMWDQMFRSTINYGRKGLPM